MPLQEDDGYESMTLDSETQGIGEGGREREVGKWGREGGGEGKGGRGREEGERGEEEGEEGGGRRRGKWGGRRRKEGGKGKGQERRRGEGKEGEGRGRRGGKRGGGGRERGGGGRSALFLTHIFLQFKPITVHTYNHIGLKSFTAYACRIQTDKRFQRMLIYYDTDTVCTFSGKSHSSSYKTTLKQQLDC